MTGSEAEVLIAELRQKLAEAEETLRAIREGEVDALVVGPAEQQEVFAIGDDSESYRSFMEAMEPGAAALDSEGRILYVNATFARLLDHSLETTQGKRLSECLRDAEAETGIESLLHSADATRRSVEIRLAENRPSPLHFIASITPMRIGTIKGHALTLTDVTARVRAEAAEQNERVARAVIASANEAVLVCDRQGIVTHANSVARAISKGDPIGQAFVDAIPLVFPEATGVIQADDIVAMAVLGSSTRGMEAVAPEAPKSKDYLVSAAPLQVAADEISGCVITMVDLSQRKAAERQQLLLMHELDHRVKNTLALVLSISSRTLSAEDTLEGFHKAFTGRIQALAATHTLLADKSWTDLSIRELLGAELAPYIDGNSDRLKIEGLDFDITPRAAIALGLVLHELATNAVKYGALSGEEGQISVRALPRNASDKAIILEWQEQGGPIVMAPSRKGFGHTVIGRSLKYSPHGGAELQFEPSGLNCRIFVPADDLR